ncbi:hypothetical protein RclHR1_01030012 [Rhizophagus clarus]|uniref:F-box domain-containing protein n=1 Tax=Rhizophagus clarus TaxID=94130 RepID=A0A2Z6Q1F9_9GLOM|nr:hypothetical protein RclHR1_01030012 [Rhizophagus clarus]GES96103.1 hypothetical protein GLOIN_2v1761327 [Rhizophagus clarus]
MRRQNGGRKQKPITGRCLFTTLPPEMFINICQNLPPVDLLSLARVCKRFNGFLSAENSMTTQEIWKASREKYLQFLQIPPPNGMTERQYVRLVLERGCQFCGKTKIRKVYWEFLVRCCEDCLKARTLRQEDIRQDIMPNVLRADDVLSGLPFIPSWHRRAWDRGTKNRPSSLYWTKDVMNAYEEYQKIPDYDLKNQWVKKKKEEGAARMREVVERKKETDKELRNKIHENSIKRNERVLQIQSKIQEMKTEKNEYGILKYSEDLTETATFKKAMSYMSRKSPQPFTDRAWTLLKKKLIKEYNELSKEKRQQRIEKEKGLPKDTIIQMRQFDIYQIAKHWVPDSETERRMEKMQIDAAESVFTSTSTLEISSSTTTSTSSSNVSIINNDAVTDNNVTNDTTLVKVEDTTSSSDFTLIKVENITDTNTIKDEVGGTSMNDNVTSTTDNTPMKIDNLISTSDSSSMNVNDINSTNVDDLNLISQNYLMYYHINNTYSYSNNNDASYNTDTNSVMSIDSLISHDASNFSFNFGSTSSAVSNSTLGPVYTDSIFYDDPMDIVDVDQYDQYAWYTPSSTSIDDYFMWDPLCISSTANSNLQQEENRFNVEKYLPWCPSFKNPPFHDGNPYNLWDEDYLMKTLMPQIWSEATHLLNSFGQATTVQGAVLGGYRENNMFKCKVCATEFAKEQRFIYDTKKLRSYRDVRLHLLEFHAVRSINDDDMIEFVPDFNTSISPDPVFSNDIKRKLFAIGFNFNLLDDLVEY